MESKTIIAILVIVAIFFLLVFGIERFFDYQRGKGKETSNAPIRQAIFSLLVAFLAMVGFAPMIVDIIIQLLNHIPGVNLRSTKSNEILGMIIFIVFCLALVGVIITYYRYRGRLYHGQEASGSGTIIKGKNLVKDSNISAGGNIHIGDKK